ncbi:MAG: hypothetical protein EBY18_04710 [Alphaproteobacteria bacterium]|nr:hypothetical protein [Alphaproteobacteria bacterium]
MVKISRILLGAVGPLMLAACTQTAGGPPVGMSAAQGMAYCTQLATLYSIYVGDTGEDLGTTYSGDEQADIRARVAIAECEEGNTAKGIPTLQNRLRDAKVPVPPPTAT